MLRSKVWLIAALIFAGVVAAGAANAQGNLKIGVVSLNRLVEQSAGFAAAQKKLEEEFGPRQRDLQAMQQRLRDQQERFQRDAPVMGEEERTTLERQIRDGQRELQRTNNEMVEDLNLRQQEEMGKLQRDAIEAAQRYARDQKYDLVLADGVLFGSSAVDITDAVLKAGPAPASAAPSAPAPSAPSSGGRDRAR
jgi:outer membrane protein